MFKKYISKLVPIILIVALCIPIVFVSGCKSSGRVDIAVTSKPAYDWVKEILGENSSLNVKQITCGGTTIQGRALVSSSKLFIYTGGVSEFWVLNALYDRSSSLPEPIILLNNVALPEWMEDDGCCGTAHLDENVWMSLVNVMAFVGIIRDAIISLDSSNSAAYTANASAFHGDLQNLYNRYVQAIGHGSGRTHNTLILAAHNAFRYLARDFVLNIEATHDDGGCTGNIVLDTAKQAALISLLNTSTIDYVVWITSQTAANYMAGASTRNISTLRLHCPQLTNTDFMVAMEANLVTLKAVLGA